jgi:hypothetical protein
MYSFTLSLNLALDGVGGQYDATFAVFTENRKLYRRLSGPRGQCGWLQKTSLPPGFDSRAVYPVESHYIDYAILAHSEEQVLRTKPTTPL